MREVRGEDGLDGRDILRVMVEDAEIAGRRVVLVGEIGGQDQRLGAVDRDGLLVRRLVDRVGPHDFHATCPKGLESGPVATRLAVGVEYHAYLHVAPLVCREITDHRRVDELVHGHVDGLLRRQHEVVDRFHPGGGAEFRGFRDHPSEAGHTLRTCLVWRWRHDPAGCGHECQDGRSNEN